MAPSSREMRDKQRRLRGKVTLIIDFLFIVNFMYMYIPVIVKYIIVSTLARTFRPSLVYFKFFNMT